MCSARTILLVVLAAPILALVPLPAPSVGATTAALPSDFDGDGWADLAIGVLGEGLGPGKRFAGASTSCTGLTGLAAAVTSSDPGQPRHQGRRRAV
jgi:hypothetical protein